MQNLKLSCVVLPFLVLVQQPNHTIFLFDMLKRTTIPIGVDDISEKAKDTWEELVIDTYNNTPRGTRSYSAEVFQSTPILTANW